MTPPLVAPVGFGSWAEGRVPLVMLVALKGLKPPRVEQVITSALAVVQSPDRLAVTRFVAVEKEEREPTVGGPEDVTVPPPAGVAQVASPRQKVVALAPVPEPRLVTGRLPVTPEVRGRPVPLARVTEAGVPKTGATKVALVVRLIAPVPLTAAASAEATPVPRPLTPEAIGKPVPLVKVTEAGVPRIGAMVVSVTPSVVAPVVPVQAPPPLL